jgi:hypothetical protein
VGSSCTALASIRAIEDHQPAVGPVTAYSSDARGAPDAASATIAIYACGRATARATLTAIASRAAVTTTATAVTGGY